MDDLISRKALLGKSMDVGLCDPYGTYYGSGEVVLIDDIKAAPTVDAVEVGNCEGCKWANRNRPQKCSCCRRNPDMKDCYEREERENA